MNRSTTKMIILALFVVLVILLLLAVFAFPVYKDRNAQSESQSESIEIIGENEGIEGMLWTCGDSVPDCDNVCYVRFNSSDWLVIGCNSKGVASMPESATLLYADLLKDFSKFNVKGGDNCYSESRLRKAMDSYADSIDDPLVKYIIPRTLEGNGVFSASEGDSTHTWCDNIAGDAVENALVWPLSQKEAMMLTSDNKSVENSLALASDMWWLRTPGSGSAGAGNVSAGGTVYVSSGDGVHRLAGVRPALWLDISLLEIISGDGSSESPYILTEGL